MERTRKSSYKNVMQRIPEVAREITEVAIKNNPAIVYDLDKIVRTHSCKSERAAELVEHVVALVASEFPKADRLYLRHEAFKTARIDDGEKDIREDVVAKISPCEGNDGWLIDMESGWSMWTESAMDGYEPHVGSKMLQYTRNLSCVLGLVIDGHVFRYKTFEQDRLEMMAQKEQRRAQERAKFPEHDAAIAKLPEIFQQRIKKFQRAPYFREDLEPYEIFVCEQAVHFAERLKTVKKLLIWYRLSYGHQVKFMPELEEAGHSGNTFGAACLMARLFLEKPEKLLEMPGALAPLVGSDAYLPLNERKKVA